MEKDHPEIVRLQFLYDAYEPQCFWFEVIETWRRIMLTGGMIYFSPGTAAQVVSSMLICLASMRINAGCQPFILETHDYLVEVSQWQLFFTLLGSLCLKVKIQ